MHDIILCVRRSCLLYTEDLSGYDILYEQVWTRFNIAHCMGAHAGLSETQAMHGQIG